MEIRRRAYELYEQRGHTPGHENEDWLVAEQEILAVSTNNIKAPRFDEPRGDSRLRLSGRAKLDKCLAIARLISGPPDSPRVTCSHTVRLSY